MARKKAPSREKSAPQKQNTAGCLIWLLLLLVTLILFVVKWGAIKETLANTGFIEVVKSIESDKPPVKGDGSLEPLPLPESKETEKELPKIEKQAPKQEASQKKETVIIEEPGTNEKSKPYKEKPIEQVPEPNSKPVEIIKATRVASLYFVKVDDDGIISRHEVKRTISASDSPLTDALAALLAGPSTEEMSKGFISLIPSDTRLLSAQVRGSTAYLDFNEAFMYNRYGIEGYAGQLRQIVYTATNFSTVKDIQILIEGQKKDYLGGDGVYIGKPLSRASF